MEPAIPIDPTDYGSFVNWLKKDEEPKALPTNEEILILDKDLNHAAS